MKIIVVSRSQNGFRRLGKFWSASETVVDVNESDYKVLKAEPALVVIDVEKAAKATVKAHAEADDKKSK